MDKTNCGRTIAVEFNGVLRDEQPLALEKMLEHDIGVLSGTTAFGKTVLAIRLIAERKVNTLVIVTKSHCFRNGKNDYRSFSQFMKRCLEKRHIKKREGERRARI
jgi:superfamily II DNA or RNA helicase